MRYNPYKEEVKSIKLDIENLTKEKFDLELVEKCYSLNIDKFEEAYLYDRDLYLVYAQNSNEAKYKIYNKIKHDNFQFKYESEKEITYLNIPIFRENIHDKYKFEDRDISLKQIHKELKQRERISKLDDILNNKEIIFCYIKKGGYYYRPNSCGYSEYKTNAGIYTKEDAVSKAKSCNYLFIVPIDIIEHNKVIKDEIEELKSKILINW
jgi:hypothetical protein